MDGLREAILGSGSRKTTILGVLMIVGALVVFVQGGELNVEAITLGFMGLLGLVSRDGGNGSAA